MKWESQADKYRSKYHELASISGVIKIDDILASFKECVAVVDELEQKLKAYDSTYEGVDKDLEVLSHDLKTAIRNGEKIAAERDSLWEVVQYVTRQAINGISEDSKAKIASKTVPFSE